MDYKQVLKDFNYPTLIQIILYVVTLYQNLSPPFCP